MSSVNDISKWRTEDPSPGMELADIPTTSVRARALLARSKESPVLRVGYLNFVGAIRMIEGLEYHHQRFLDIIAQLCRGDATARPGLDHEATAYLNRLGQFCYFAGSKFVEGRVSDALDLIPTFEKLFIFRH